MLLSYDRDAFKKLLTILVIVIVIVVTIIIARAIPSDTGCAERNLCLGCFPVADTLHFGIVVVMLIITASGDSDYGATSLPAAVWNIILLQFGCDCDVAGQNEAGESEELLGPHDG